ncbi:MAG: hypothetical protein IT373_35425 [Polyangiaceae bacterium]|nr:hypothetical protein [Polyangiaceae bacterium]
MDPKALTEHAKDIAAFANALGGTILVGAAELPDGVAYAGLPADLAREVAEGYKLALRGRVRPRPRVEVVEIRDPATDRVVVAVNVHAYADQPVGCAVDTVQDDKGARLKPLTGEAVAWRFPQRVSNHCRWIQPEELAMLMNPHARRVTLLLERIPSEHRQAVTIQNWHVRQDNPDVVKVTLERVDLDANVMCIKVREASPLRIPLDDVEAVWEASPGTWHVRVNGHVGQFGNEHGWRYVSYPRS